MELRLNSPIVTMRIMDKKSQKNLPTEYVNT